MNSSSISIVLWKKIRQQEIFDFFPLFVSKNDRMNFFFKKFPGKKCVKCRTDGKMLIFFLFFFCFSQPKIKSAKIYNIGDGKSGWNIFRTRAPRFIPLVQAELSVKPEKRSMCVYIYSARQPQTQSCRIYIRYRAVICLYSRYKSSDRAEKRRVKKKEKIPTTRALVFSTPAARPPIGTDPKPVFDPVFEFFFFFGKRGRNEGKFFVE